MSTNTDMSKEEQINKLASRHIARCLDFLGDTLAPTQIVSIKRSFRFFADDVKQVANTEASNNEHTDGT